MVLYGRTSDDVSEGRSVDDQLAELRHWAKATDREVVAELRDDGISASRYARGKARPDWQTAMDLIGSGKADELGVWEISRSTRDRAVWAALIAACIDQRVDLAVSGKVHDPTDPDDGFMLDLGAALAVRESAVISKRTQRAVDSRAQAGRPHGTVPYGYRRVLDAATGRTIGREIDPVQGPVVREIVERMLARESARSIAADLNGRQMLTVTGKPWLSGNLRHLVLRPSYAGLRTYKGEILPDVEVTWPPLISLAEREQLLALYADPARDKFRNSTSVKHLGSGLYRCGRPECGGTMRVIRQRDLPPAYTCRACFKISRYQDPVDRQVVKLITARLSRDDVLELLAEASEDDAVKAAAADVARLKGRLRELRQKVDAEVLDLDDYAAFKAKWKQDLKDAEQRARPRWLPAAVWEVAGPDAEAKWKAQTIAGKRSILAALFEVTILPAGSQSLKFDPDLIEVTWRESAS